MFCQKCGRELNEGAEFCAICGASIPLRDRTPGVGRMELNEELVVGNVRLCPDGVYRWIYELNMMRNPTVLLTVFKVLGISLGTTYLICLLIGAFTDSLYGWEGVWGMTKVFFLIALGFFVIGCIAYLIVSASFGGKYIVLFEMTNDCIKHIQTPGQFKKGQAIGWLAVMSGLAAGSPAAMGLGISTMARNTLTSEFKSVSSLRSDPRRHVIYVKQALSKNQVYIGDTDFEFVWQFITRRCGGAVHHEKKKERRACLSKSAKNTWRNLRK